MGAHGGTPLQNIRQSKFGEPLVYWYLKTRPHAKMPKTSDVEGIKMTKRREFTAKFKFQVALEAMKGMQTINEIASQYEVHPT
jgi:hypothetical protein